LGLFNTACEGSGGFQQMKETGLEAKTDESGAFLFEGVPPGCYTLFAIISFQKVVFKSESGMVLFEALAGQSTDLGSIPLIRK